MRRELTVDASDANAGDAPATAAQVSAVLHELHVVKQLLHRLAVPVDVLTTEQAASRLGRSRRTIETLAARGIFTDGRAPGNRTKGAPRLYYADELEVYRAEGEAGVARLRDELGRAGPAVERRRVRTSRGNRGRVK